MFDVDVSTQFAHVCSHLEEVRGCSSPHHVGTPQLHPKSLTVFLVHRRSVLQVDVCMIATILVLEVYFHFSYVQAIQICHRGVSEDEFHAHLQDNEKLPEFRLCPTYLIGLSFHPYHIM
jgi:hypothetical protein